MTVNRRSLRVALVCGAFRPSRDGVAHYVARLAGALRSASVDVVVVGGDGGEAGAEVVTRGWDTPGARRAGDAVRRMGADVVHVQWAPTAYGPRRDVSALLPALDGSRLVTTLHEYDGPTDADAEALAAASDRVLVTNPVHGRRLASRLPTAPVAHVPIAANLDVHHDATRPDRRAARVRLRRTLGAPGDAPVVVFFGFVHPVKGIRYLLPAVARLRATRPEVRLVLAGGFESLALTGGEADAWRAEVEGLVAAEGLADAVWITGFLPERDASVLLAGADVGVLPFTAGTTTKSGSLLALAAHDVPVVATVADPPDPELRGGEQALLVGVRDAAALTGALDRVLGDEDLAARLRVGGRRLGATRSWTAIAAAHLAVYEDLLR